MKRVRCYSDILFGVTLLFWFSQYAYASYVNPELEKMGATAVFMGYVGGIYGFMSLIVRIPIGISSDKWQKKAYICSGSLCACVASACMLVFHHPIAFLIGRSLGGIAVGTWVTFTVLYSSYYKPEDSTRAITMINLANQIGRVLSFVVAGFFVARFSSQAAFLIAAIGGFLAFLLSLFVHEDVIQDKNPISVHQLFAAARDRNLLITSLLAVLVQLVSYATFFSFTSNYAVSIGATQAQLSYMNVALLAPGMVLSFFMSKYILKYIDPKWLASAGFLAIAIYSAVMPFVSTIPQLYLLQSAAGIGNVLTLPLLMGLCVRDIPPEKRGAAMGFFQAIFGVGMTLGPIIMGLLVDHLDLRAGFLIMAGISAASTFLAVLLLQGRRMDSQS